MVYSERAMRHLASASRIVYLDVPLAELRARIRDYETRGIARRPDHAELRIDCDRLGMEDVLERILAELAAQPRK